MRQAIRFKHSDGLEKAANHGKPFFCVEKLWVYGLYLPPEKQQVLMKNEASAGRSFGCASLAPLCSTTIRSR
ncbi:MAG: hypothetical protein ACREV3_09705 [Gammaproteobacteria bacterium]